MSYLMTVWYLQAYLEVGLKKYGLINRTFSLHFTTAPLLKSVMGIKILLYVVPVPFIWKPLRSGVNVEEMPVSSCVHLDMCEHWSV